MINFMKLLVIPLFFVGLIYSYSAKAAEHLDIYVLNEMKQKTISLEKYHVSGGLTVEHNNCFKGRLIKPGERCRMHVFIHVGTRLDNSYELHIKFFSAENPAFPIATAQMYGANYSGSKHWMPQASCTFYESLGDRTRKAHFGGRIIKYSISQVDINLHNFCVYYQYTFTLKDP